MNHDKADEVIKGLFESRLSRYKCRLETSMRCSDFVFDYVNLLYCKSYKLNFKLVRSDHIYILLTEKGNKKATINSINVDDKFFQYAAAVALNHGEISKICKELKEKVFYI